MSVLSPEAVAVGNGTDLASLVVAYHRRAHTSVFISECVEGMCRTANEVVELEEIMFGLDA